MSRRKELPAIIEDAKQYCILKGQPLPGADVRAALIKMADAKVADCKALAVMWERYIPYTNEMTVGEINAAFRCCGFSDDVAYKKQLWALAVKYWKSGTGDKSEIMRFCHQAYFTILAWRVNNHGYLMNMSPDEKAIAAECYGVAA